MPQFLSPLGLIGASFANAPWQLYLSEGVLFGLGGCLLYNPSVYLPAQWFKKNRALATGIVYAPVYTVSVEFKVFHQMTYASTLSGLGVCGTGIGGLALSLVGFPIDIDLQITNWMLIHGHSHRSPKS